MRVRIFFGREQVADYFHEPGKIYEVQDRETEINGMPLVSIERDNASGEVIVCVRRFDPDDETNSFAEPDDIDEARKESDAVRGYVRGDLGFGPRRKVNRKRPSPPTKTGDLDPSTLRALGDITKQKGRE